MKTVKTLGEELLLADDLYQYKNDIATYNLLFKLEPVMHTKFDILCAKEDLEDELSATIDQWREPHQMDILDLTICLFDTVEYNGRVFFLYSYKILIEVADREDMAQAQPGEAILLPYFESKTLRGNRRRIKSFSGFGN